MTELRGEGGGDCRMVNAPILLKDSDWLSCSGGSFRRPGDGGAL